jgi:hypothetical protein
MNILVIFIIILIIFIIIDKQKSLTVVSAYYDIPSKRSSEIYHERLKRFLGKLDCNMVFYTSSDQIEKLKSYRGKYNYKTKFYILEKDELQSIKKYGLDFWKEQCILYKDTTYENKPYLGAIWNNKKEFVINAISKNDFNTSHYAWIDAGLIENDISKEVLVPNTGLLSDKVTLYSVNNIPQNEVVFFDHTMPDYIAGDTYFGPKNKLLDYSGHFDTVMKLYTDNGKSVYMDQNVMTTLAKQYKDQYHIVQTDFKWRQLFKMLVGDF